ncbi:MAG: efflux RND transporter periplasmic adaptor subunit [Sulfuricellaceae bacterium]
MARPSFFRPLILVAILAAAGSLAWFAWGRNGADAAQRYRTAEVERGDITQSIAANGTLNPVVLVNVGTQVSGTVKKLYADFNDRVKPNQVLAELDPALFRAQVQQSEANLANAKANLELAIAREKRNRDLYQKKFISADALDQAVQTRDSARAQVMLAQAQLEKDRTNLQYSVIRSPISGVVVARNVDVGQTVAASFQTPTLFQIAKDLREMQIDTTVAEADVGAVEVGQKVKFSVDAFPERNFVGQVKQIRLNPTIQQNVVTYNVVVGVDNADGKLMPGMTAHIRVVVAQKKDALRIPKEALRFKPADEEGKDQGEKGKKRAGSTVYRLEGNRLEAVPVKVGIADTNFVEVTEGDLKPGDLLVTKELAGKKDKNNAKFQVRPF